MRDAQLPSGSGRRKQEWWWWKQDEVCRGLGVSWAGIILSTLSLTGDSTIPGSVCKMGRFCKIKKCNTFPDIFSFFELADLSVLTIWLCLVFLRPNHAYLNGTDET
jgi:hypothetical protein